ncbi:MAG TPA: hypothetical protein VNJ53_07800 [Gaiellaceae bacterium]|nr:hypothetical protein [Gaiellaceae bacterium]
MALDLAALANELRTDPAALGYAPLVASGSDAALADLLNRRNRAGRRPIAVAPLLLRAAASGVLAILTAASQDLTKPAAVRAAALAILKVLDRVDTLDLDDPALRGVLDGLVAAGVLTAAQRDAVVAFGNAQISRAEELFGPGTVVSHLDVARALGRG